MRPRGVGWFAWHHTTTCVRQKKEEKKHAQPFLPDLLTLRVILVEPGLGEKGMGLVVKLNLRMYLHAVPFTSVCNSSLYHSLLGRACQLPIKEMARAWVLWETGHGFSCKGQVWELIPFLCHFLLGLGDPQSRECPALVFWRGKAKMLLFLKVVHCLMHWVKKNTLEFL